MTDRYLLDTNIVSELVRDPQGRIFSRIADVGSEAVATSIIVACEMVYGAAKKRSQRLSKQVEGVLERLPVLPLEQPVVAVYGRIRADLQHQGCPIGANDLLIAAHALALGRILVTANTREFDRIPDLPVENWLV